MDPSGAKESFSGSELAAGALALAAVALIAFVGLRASPPQDPSAPVTPPTVASISESREPSRADPNPELRASQSADPVAVNEAAPSAPDPSAEPGSGAVVNPQGDPLEDSPRESGRPSVSEPPMPSAERTGLKPLNPAPVQARLRELGYFFGTATGVWWTASHRALRDFKSMNGLPEDHRWDKETAERLFSEQAIRASSTFIGRWTEGNAHCSHGPGAPLMISSRGAKSAGGECDFRSVRREATGRWRVGALCFVGGNSWTANISLQLLGSRLTWSSERGTATYVRCANR
jgi:Putative peptidoglycan binding domain